MAYTSSEILAALEKSYPQTSLTLNIPNCSDKRFELKQKIYNQYIIGVTAADQFNGGIDRYKYSMQEALKPTSLSVACLPWHFNGYENEEMKAALSELAEDLNIAINVEEMIKSLKIPRDESGSFYIVVTVVQYLIAYAE